MTLLSQVQTWLEATYAPSGINLEECLVGARRRSQLLLASGAHGLSPWGQTFLWVQPPTLRLAIYYNPGIIAALEQDDPRERINERNLHPLVTFIEEITHALQAAWSFTEGVRDLASEDFARQLECQGRIDTCLILYKLARMVCGGVVPNWLRLRLEEAAFDPGDFPDEPYRSRYAESAEIAASFVRSVQALPNDQRLEHLRTFRRCTWSERLKLRGGNAVLLS